MNFIPKSQLPDLRGIEASEGILEVRGIPATAFDSHEAVEAYRVFADGGLAEAPHAQTAYLNRLRRRIY